MGGRNTTHTFPFGGLVFNKFTNDFSDTDPVALDAIVNNVLYRQSKVSVDSPVKMNFRCTVCGDSHRDASASRGYILKSSEPWIYYCHNCGISIPVTAWLSRYFQDDFREYRELIHSPFNRSKITAMADENAMRRAVMEESIKAHAEQERLKDISEYANFYPIQNFPDAMQYMIARGIPLEVLAGWFFAPQGYYGGRIIIPYRNPAGNVYNFIARTIIPGVEPKYYFARWRDPKFVNIYNFYNIDRSRPVVILEGQLDTHFAENSIGVGGIGKEPMGFETIKNKIYLPDLDSSGIKSMKRMIEWGESVFDWFRVVQEFNLPPKPKWDVNDLARHIGATNLPLDWVESYTIKGAGNILPLMNNWRDYERHIA